MTLPIAPTLETARLILRAPLAGDLDAWCELMADEQAARFIGGVQPRGQVWRNLRQLAGGWALDGHGYFSVVEKASGRWIGRVGPWNPPGWPGPEVGWAILRSAWGQGFALEAAVAAMDWTAANLPWPVILHVIHPENARSKALARRLGSTARGPCRLPPPFEGEEFELWGQDAAAWRARPR